MNIDLTQIILAVITLIGSIITTFLVPLLNTKLKIAKANLSETQAMLLDLAISTTVAAAEQIFRSDEGKQKKAYVIEQLRQQGYDVDSGAIDAAIEAEVLRLHRGLNEGILNAN